MYLHGTNQPLAKGALITSAKVRKDKTSYTQSLSDHVYFVDTEYEPPAGGDWVCRPDNYDDAEYDELDKVDAQTSLATRALSSAMFYGVRTAAQRGVHPSSRFMGASMTIASYGEPDEMDFDYRDVDGPLRLRRNLEAIGEPSWWVLTDAEWEAMSPQEQEAFNARCEAELPRESAVAKDLRGYWVYEVQVVGGDPERDRSGQHHADRRVPSGVLKVVDVVIADGVLLRDEFQMPSWKAHFPAADEEDFDRYESWYSAPVVLPVVDPSVANALKGAQGGGGLCGAPASRGESCKRVVLAGTHCWQH